MKGKTMITFLSQSALTDTGVNFPVLIDNRRAVCSITFEALQDKFQVLNNIEAGFNANRNAINNLARILIELNPNEDRYLITTSNPAT